MNERDELLEAAARLIEALSLDELRGIMARRKRDREDADLRSRTIRETRKQCAAEVRRYKNNPRSDPLAVLERLAALREVGRHDLYLAEAWPLARSGWLRIEVSIVLNSNSVPPPTEYRITLTDIGKAALAAHKATFFLEHELPPLSSSEKEPK